LPLQDNHYRTLTNQIISHGVKIVILENFFIHLPMTFRYFFDQAPENFCQVIFFIGSCQLLKKLFVGIAFMIVHYIYNFHARNITAIQDEFWICFFNIWSSGFSAIAYIIICQISDNRPRHFYICLGKMSQKAKSNSPYVDYFFNAFFLLDMITLIYVGAKFTIREYLVKNRNKLVVKRVGQYFKEIKKTNLFSLALCLVAGVVIAVIFLIPFYKIEYSDWESLSTYPGYLWIYMFHLFYPSINNIIIPLVFGRNLYLRNFAKRVIKEKFTILIGSFT
jgi:hypothetical protein